MAKLAQHEYIEGYCVAGTTAYTFSPTLSGTRTNVTVYPDSNGYWRWYLPNDDIITSCAYMFTAMSQSESDKLVRIKFNIDFSQCVSIFAMCGLTASSTIVCSNIVKVEGLNIRAACNNVEVAFNGCQNLEELDVSQWITTGITSLYQTFRDCRKLSVIDMSNWSVTNLQSIVGAFSNCRAVEVLDVSKLNVDNVSIFSNIFLNCISLRKLDLSLWNTSNATSMFRMLFCNIVGSQLTELKLCAIPNGTDVSQMFSSRNITDILSCGNIGEISGELSFANSSNMTLNSAKIVLAALQQVNTTCTLTFSSSTLALVQSSINNGDADTISAVTNAIDNGWTITGLNVIYGQAIQVDGQYPAYVSIRYNGAYHNIAVNSNNGYFYDCVEITSLQYCLADTTSVRMIRVYAPNKTLHTGLFARRSNAEVIDLSNIISTNLYVAFGVNASDYSSGYRCKINSIKLPSITNTTDVNATFANATLLTDVDATFIENSLNMRYSPLTLQSAINVLNALQDVTSYGGKTLTFSSSTIALIYNDPTAMSLVDQAQDYGWNVTGFAKVEGVCNVVNDTFTFQMRLQNTGDTQRTVSTDSNGKWKYTLTSAEYSNIIGLEGFASVVSQANADKLVEVKFSNGFPFANLNTKPLRCAFGSYASSYFGCRYLTKVEGLKLPTVAAASTAYESLFSNCISLTNVDISGLNGAITSGIHNMFRRVPATEIIGLAQFMSQAAPSGISNLYYNCSNLTHVSIPTLNNGTLLNDDSFGNCTSLTTIDYCGNIGSIETGSSHNPGTLSFAQSPLDLDSAKLILSKLQDLNGSSATITFSNSTNALISADQTAMDLVYQAINYGWDVTGFGFIEGYSTQANSNISMQINGSTYTANTDDNGYWLLDVSGVNIISLSYFLNGNTDVTKVKFLCSLINNNYVDFTFANCTNLTEIKGFNVTSNVTSANYAFGRSGTTTTIRLTTLENVDNFDFSNCVDLRAAFTNFGGDIDMTNWDVESSTRFYGTFARMTGTITGTANHKFYSATDLYGMFMYLDQVALRLDNMECPNATTYERMFEGVSCTEIYAPKLDILASTNTTNMFRLTNNLTDLTLGDIYESISLEHSPLTLQSAIGILSNLQQVTNKTITFSATTSALIQADSTATALVTQAQNNGWTIIYN